MRGWEGGKSGVVGLREQAVKAVRGRGEVRVTMLTEGPHVMSFHQHSS